MKKNSALSVLLIGLLGIQLQSPVPAFGQDEDSGFLLLYFKEEDLFVESSTRGRKSLTQAAENITIVTAEEIKLMNAHTLAEVLNTVPGVQVFLTGGPGSFAQASIQGSENRHVAVLIDGVPLNNLGESIADIGAVPVQNIEKIEIVKGPASSAWGSALGGVINIITKSSRSEETNGLLSASYGKANTGDFRAEASGRGERLGYYVAAGTLQTDGFRLRNDFSGRNGFAKLSYDFTNSTQVMVSTNFDRFDRGILQFPAFYMNNELEGSRSTLSLTSAVSREVTVNLGFWRLRQEFDVYTYENSTGLQLSREPYLDTGYGSSAKLNWKHEGHHLVLGTDIDARKLRSTAITGGEQSQRKRAYYLNDTITFGRLSVTPGVRRDETATNGDINSPSIGMTYKPADTVLLRTYAARGFSIPVLSATFGGNEFTVPNPELRMERVKSYQAGAETTALPFVWLKAGVFRHDITDMIKPETLPGPQRIAVNGDKVRKQGIEIELKTRSVHFTFLSAGAVFMNTRDAATGRTLPDMPQRTYDIGLHYEHASVKALLTGHSIYWNSSEASEGKYKAMIFDAHAARTLYAGPGRKLEVFADLHNIFNGEQYAISLYKNPGRWAEAGVRCLF